MRLLRWLWWLLVLAVVTGGIYIYLEKRSGDKASNRPAVDQTTEEDRQQLDQLIDRLQKKQPSEAK